MSTLPLTEEDAYIWYRAGLRSAHSDGKFSFDRAYMYRAERQDWLDAFLMRWCTTCQVRLVYAEGNQRQFLERERTVTGATIWR